MCQLCHRATLRPWHPRLSPGTDFDSHLCEAAIDKQFRSRHEGYCHPMRETPRPSRPLRVCQPANRDSVGTHFQTLPASFRGTQHFIQSRRVDKAGAEGIHSNATNDWSWNQNAFLAFLAKRPSFCSAWKTATCVAVGFRAEATEITSASLALPRGEILEDLLRLLAGDHRVVQPNVLVFVLVDPGVARLASS